MDCLSMFHFQIVHVEGKKNVVADALSRKPQVSAMSISYHNELEEMKGQYAEDEDTARIYDQIVNGQRHEDYTLNSDFLMMHGKLCITKHLRSKVLIECHAPSYAGHRGIDATVLVYLRFLLEQTLILYGASHLFVLLSSMFSALVSTPTAPHVKGSGVSGVITFGTPFDACSSFDAAASAQLDSSLFLLTMRGNCSFEAKVRYAQDANFSAVIIYNNESGSSLLTMSGSSEGISIHAVFVTRETGEALFKYADDSSSKVWIVPSYENTVWSVMVFSLISLLAVGAFLITWYIVRRHRQRRLGGRLSRHDEHFVMSIRIVQAMPSATYRVVGNEKAAQESCVICQEEYINGEQMRILPCSHRFHCSCVDAWLTMWRAVCPICKRDARYEFPDLQVSERSPLLSFSSGGGRGSYGTKEASSSESPPIQIPPSYPDSQMGFLDLPSCSKGTAASCSRFIPSSLSNSLLFRRSSALDGSLEAFRASPYFTPPSLSQNTSPLLPGSYAAPYLLDCSPVVGSPSSFSSGPRNTWSKSFLNPGKVSRASSAAGSFSPHSCGSRNVS
ncbi:hypothetical protein L7F22_030743 [Adiantum nelumboides]|nr:hypothetical protein [Adiantum nelumboides]